MLLGLIKCCFDVLLGLGITLLFDTPEVPIMLDDVAGEGFPVTIGECPDGE